jgi:hypothetical protein
MKAKEWAARFEETQDLGVALAEFVAEIGAIAAQRGHTLNGTEGAVREQKVKFEAICRLTKRVYEAMWPVLMATHGRPYLEAVKAYLKQCEARAAKPEKDWRKKPGRPGRGGPRPDNGRRPAGNRAA